MNLQSTPGSLIAEDNLAQDSTKILFGTKDVQQGLPELARHAAAEGIVLLKNENHALPLDRSGMISVFGRIQNDYMYVGHGSGGDVNPPYKISLMDCLRKKSDGIINEELAAVYQKWCVENPADLGEWGHWARSFPEMPISDEIVENAAQKSETAVVIIGRTAGEAGESTLTKGSYYLTNIEKDMLDKVTDRFSRVIVIVNSGNIIDMSWLEQYGNRISALLYVWQGGMEGPHAVADILFGDVIPSGKLTDTIALQYEDYPGANDFGGKEYNNYVEDIYVGYRYFETFSKESVLYPFGFGLSYTKFGIQTNSVSIENGVVNVTVTVTNTGTQYAGKETVQVYYSTPQGVLGKPVRNLAAFAKTKDLAPQESQTISMEFELSDMASYDDAGKTGYKSAYVMDAGVYEFFAGNNVRDAKKIGSHEVNKLTLIKQLQEVNAIAPEKKFRRLTPITRDDGNFTEHYEDIPVRTNDLKSRIEKNLPAAIDQTGDRGIKLDDVKNGKSSIKDFIAQLSIEELSSLCHGYGPMNCPLGAQGNAGGIGGLTKQLRDKGVAPVITTDGPSGIRLATYTSLIPCGTALACTWNTGLVQELSTLLAKEMILKGSDILLSPGMNIHRNPLCGRNFEYFSEDPLLTGHIASAVVNGLQSQGVSACPKHFACNNQEDERNKNDSRVSERALREIYLKGFEICIEKSKPQNIMTSYNKVNGIWSHYNYDLCTTVLRGEWGYDGNVMTDWWMQSSVDPDFPELTDNAYRVRAQVDVLMPGCINFINPKIDSTLLESYGKPNGITLGEMQRSAKNVLRFILQSKAMEKQSNSSN